MSYVKFDANAASPGKNVTRFFPLSAAYRAPTPDLTLDHKQILRDYCSVIDKELTHYGDFPSLKDNKIERIKIIYINGRGEEIGQNSPRYYPDYMFMYDGMNLYGSEDHVRFSGNEGGARPNIKGALRALDEALTAQDTPPEYSSTKLLQSALKKLTVALARIESEIFYLKKQMETLNNAKLTTNDDWNYYKSANALLVKMQLRLSRLVTSLSQAITGPVYDKIYIEMLANELAGKN